MQDRRCFVEGNYTFFCNRVLPCRLVARRKYPQAVTFATARNDDEVEPAGDWVYFFPYIFQTFTALHLVAITTSHEVASRILITCILYLTVSSFSLLVYATTALFMPLKAKELMVSDSLPADKSQPAAIDTVRPML